MRHTFTWVLAKIVSKKLEKGETLVHLGMCDKTGHLAKISLDFLTPMVVRDFYVKHSEGKEVECEEGRRCWYFNCPLNHTNPRWFLDSQGIEKGPTKMGADSSLGRMGNEITKERWKIEGHNGTLIADQDCGPIVEIEFEDHQPDPK